MKRTPQRADEPVHPLVAYDEAGHIRSHPVLPRRRRVAAPRDDGPRGEPYRQASAYRIRHHLIECNRSFSRRRNGARPPIPPPDAAVWCQTRGHEICRGSSGVGNAVEPVSKVGSVPYRVIDICHGHGCLTVRRGMSYAVGRIYGAADARQTDLLSFVSRGSRTRKCLPMPPDRFVTFTLHPQDPSWRSGWDPMVELAEPTRHQDLPQSVFVWRYFQVKVVFRAGGVDLSQSMRVAVSILEFVLMSQAAKATMRREGSGHPVRLAYRDRVGKTFRRNSGSAQG
jgi:hypothetical protein